MSGPLEAVIGWEAGGHHGLAWEGGCAVLDGAVPAGLAAAVWSRMRGGGDLWGFLQALTDLCGGSLLHLPGFAVVLIGDGDAHAAARGPFEVLAVAGGVELRCDGEGVTTWTERRLGAIDEVTLSAVGAGTTGAPGAGGPGAGGPRAGADALPLVAGVVPAGRLTWITGLGRSAATPHGSTASALPVDVLDALPVDVPGPTPMPSPVPPAVPPVPMPQPGPPPVPPVPMPHPEPRPGVAPPQPPDEPPRVDIEPTDQPEAGQPDAERPSAPAVEVFAEADTGTPDQADTGAPDQADTGTPDQPEPAPVSGRFAQLFAEDTIMGPVQAAAVHASEPSASEAVTAEYALPDPTDGDADPMGLADHDGQTIIGARPGGSPMEAAPGSLEGVLCQAGHVNPPGRARCRACGGAMGSQPANLAPGVPIGWLQASSGPSLELTGTIIVGRQPMASRVEGTRMPALLALPYGHISGTHLEIRVDGWEVYATDLNSTNGTFLHRGQEQPRRITTQPLRLAAGDVLDLGHGVRLTFPDMP